MAYDNDIEVEVATDPWILWEDSCTLILATRNAQLLHPSRSWREDLVRELFLEKDANDINLNIRINTQSKQDEIIWNQDPKGLLSPPPPLDVLIGWGTKSKTLQKLQSWEITTRNLDGNDFGKTRILSKYKVCGWKIYNDILLTCSNLITLRLDINPSCLFCMNQSETTKHIFWECKVTNGMWATFFSVS